MSVKTSIAPIFSSGMLLMSNADALP